MKRIPALLAALAFAPVAHAADLGGNCCADLEERIAELEATTARKGNRKVSLTVYGEINKSLLWVEQGDNDAKGVIENGASASRFGFRGDAKIAEGYSAGYVLEIGVGSFELDVRRRSIGLDNDNDLEVRHSFVYLSTPAGKVSLGQTSQATDSVAEITTANTGVAINTLNLKPLFSESPWDGGRANLVRYDTPTVAGFTASASWTTEGNEAWDVAIRYAGEFAGVKLAAGAGYRAVDLAFGEQKVTSGSVSAKHMGSGLFATGAAGFNDVGSTELTGYHVVAGLERNVLGFGATTVYGEWLRGEEEVTTATGTFPGPIVIKTTTDDTTVYGAGLVQAIDAAALDLYIMYRTSEDLDGSYGMAGGRIRF